MGGLVDLVAREGDFPISEQVIAKFLALGEEVRFAPKSPVIEYGRIDNRIYIVKSGILRVVYYEEDKEITYGFATPGTVFFSPHCYYRNQPAVMQFETCRKGATCIAVPKSGFEALIAESHEFARWMFDLAMGQFYTCEQKLKYIRGDARKRIVAVLKYRPEIVEVVSARTLASYIGVTESYFCRIRKEMRLAGEDFSVSGIAK